MAKYVAIITYANQDRVPETRPAHRAYLGSLKERGQVVVAGPFEGDSGALIIYEAGTEDEVRRLIAEDPFSRAGVFDQVELREWTQVF